MESFLEFLFNAGEEFFETLFAWIVYTITFVLDRFLISFFSLSPIIRSTGRTVVTSFDSLSSFDFSGDFIYLFVGLLVIVFIFKLVWLLIP